MSYSYLARMVLCANIPLNFIQKTSKTSEKKKQEPLKSRRGINDLPKLSTKIEEKENAQPPGVLVQNKYGVWVPID